MQAISWGKKHQLPSTAEQYDWLLPCWTSSLKMTPHCHQPHHPDPQPAGPLVESKLAVQSLRDQQQQFMPARCSPSVQIPRHQLRCDSSTSHPLEPWPASHPALAGRSKLTLFHDLGARQRLTESSASRCVAPFKHFPALAECHSSMHQMRVALAASPQKTQQACMCPYVTSASKSKLKPLSASQPHSHSTGACASSACGTFPSAPRHIVKPEKAVKAIIHRKTQRQAAHQVASFPDRSADVQAATAASQVGSLQLPQTTLLLSALTVWACHGHPLLSLPSCLRMPLEKDCLSCALLAERLGPIQELDVDSCNVVSCVHAHADGKFNCDELACMAACIQGLSPEIATGHSR